MYEVPPTAGLPLHWRDLLAGNAAALASGLASLIGVPVQLACSGTACLVLALNELRGTSRRSSVVIPAYTCPLVPLAILHAGLRVELCDVLPGHFDLAPDALAAACGPDTLAVIPTHLGGRVANVPLAVATAARVGAFVIEDAAQALGARAGTASVGTLGDAGFFSLAAGKGLTTFEGGILVTRDPERRRKARTAGASLPYRPILEAWRALELLAYAAGYNPAVLALAYGWPLRRRLHRRDLLSAVGDNLDGPIPLHRLSAWRQAVAASALARLPAFQRQLERQALERCALVQQVSGLDVLVDRSGDRGVWPVLMVLMPGPVERDAALARLWASGTGVARMFLNAIPDYPYLKGRVPAVDVPHARALADRLLTVSNSPWLGDDRFSTILGELGEAARRGHY